MDRSNMELIQQILIYQRKKLIILLIRNGDNAKSSRLRYRAKCSHDLNIYRHSCAKRLSRSKRAIKSML